MKKLYNKSKKIFGFVGTLPILLLPLITEAQIKYDLVNHLNVSETSDNPIAYLLLAILNIFIVIAIPIVVLFIIYAGFMYVTARGNVSQTEEATRTLTYAIIGGVLVLGAVAISEIVANVVGAFTN